MAHSAIMSVRITGNSDDAVKAFQKATSKAAAFGSFMGGAALKGVTALWDKLKDFGGAVIDTAGHDQWQRGGECRHHRHLHDSADEKHWLQTALCRRGRSRRLHRRTDYAAGYGRSRFCHG